MDEQTKDLTRLKGGLPDDFGAKMAKHIAASRSAVVRVGFSMPEEDYVLIDAIRKSCLEGGVIVTKSGILRAALIALNQLSPQEQIRLVQGLAAIKTGRPPGQN